jgi:hypothetical protein
LAKQTKHEHINKLLELFRIEEEPFRKAHRMIDLFESIIKTHTVVLTSNYFLINTISDEMKAYFAARLKVPSLGVWQELSRAVADELAFNYIEEEKYNLLKSIIRQPQQVEKFEQVYLKIGSYYIVKNGSFSWLKNQILPLIKEHQLEHLVFNRFFISGFYEYFCEWDNKQVSKVIEKRNYLAHGATPENKICLEIIQSLKPILEKWLEAAWLHETSIISFRKKDGLISTLHIETKELYPLSTLEQQPICKEIKRFKQPYLIRRDGKLLDLFPMMIIKYVSDKKVYSNVFFNDFKKKKEASYLNYPYAIHFKERDLYSDILAVINIEEWGKHEPNEFSERIHLLKENFKGRSEDLKFIDQFIANSHRGFLFLYGNPGVGKSAIAANIGFKKEQESGLSFIRYFIKRKTFSSEIDHFLTFFYKELESKIKTNIPYGNTYQEINVNLHKRLLAVSKKLGNKKLVICIDGLDEGTDDQQNIIPFLLKETYENILVIYTSQLSGEVENFLLHLPIEYTTKQEIAGLDRKSIRAMLYEVENKYKITDTHIEMILDKSEGNPLYLTLLCQAIENGELSLETLHTMPKKISSYYKLKMNAYKKKENHDTIYQMLLILAIAQDYLTKHQLEVILELSPSSAEDALADIQEVLIEKKTAEGHYQLFHESLRKFFIKEYKVGITRMEEKLISYCMNWKQHLSAYSGDAMIAYPLKYLAVHFYNKNQSNALFELVNNEEYRKQQIDVTQSFSASYMVHQYALQAATKINDEERLIAISNKIHQLQTGHLSHLNDDIKSIQQGNHHKLEDLFNKISSFNEKQQLEYCIQLLHYLSASPLKNKELILIVIKGMEEHIQSEENLIGENVEELILIGERLSKANINTDFFTKLGVLYAIQVNKVLYQILLDSNQLRSSFALSDDLKLCFAYSFLQRKDVTQSIQYLRTINIVKVDKEFYTNTLILLVASIDENKPIVELLQDVKAKNKLKVLEEILEKVIEEVVQSEQFNKVKDLISMIENSIKKFYLLEKYYLKISPMDKNNREAVLAHLLHLYDHAAQEDQSYMCISIIEILLKLGQKDKAKTILSDVLIYQQETNQEQLAFLMFLTTDFMEAGDIGSPLEILSIAKYEKAVESIAMRIAYEAVDYGLTKELYKRIKDIVDDRKKKYLEEFLYDKLIKVTDNSLFDLKSMVLRYGNKKTKNMSFQKDPHKKLDVKVVELTTYLKQELSDKPLTLVHSDRAWREEGIKCEIERIRGKLPKNEDIENVSKVVMVEEPYSEEFYLNILSSANKAIVDSKWKDVIDLTYQLDKWGKQSDAEYYIQEAYQAALKIHSYYGQPARFNLIDKVLDAYIDQNRMKQLIETALRVEETIKDTIFFSEFKLKLFTIYEKVSNVCITRGYIEEANAIMDKAIENGYSPQDAFMWYVRIIKQFMNNRTSEEIIADFIKKAEIYSVLQEVPNEAILNQLRLLEIYINYPDKVVEYEEKLELLLNNFPSSIEKVEILTLWAKIKYPYQLNQAKEKLSLAFEILTNKLNVDSFQTNELQNILVNYAHCEEEDRSIKVLETILSKKSSVNEYKEELELFENILKVSNYNRLTHIIDSTESIILLQYFYEHFWKFVHHKVNILDSLAVGLKKGIIHRSLLDHSLFHLSYYLVYFTAHDYSKKQHLIEQIQEVITLPISIEEQFVHSKTFDNVGDWINTITNPDYREDVMDWLKKVENGQWEKEKFNRRVKGLFSE